MQMLTFADKQTAQLVDEKVRGLDLITMQLPQVTPQAATHTTNCEHVVFANNIVNDREEGREAVYIMHFFPTALQLLCFSRVSFPLYISNQALAKLFLLSTLLCWSFAASHPCALSAADWLT